MALTDIKICNAKPGEKPRKLGDSAGLFLLVQQSGGKLWRLKYRIDGKEKKLSLGRYPDISVQEARRRRDEARTSITPKVTHHAALLDEKSVGGLMRAIDTFSDQPLTCCALQLTPHVFVRPGDFVPPSGTSLI